MAMNGNNLGNAVADALEAYFASAPDTHEPGSEWGTHEFWRIVCNQIVGHIQANAKCSGVDSHSDTHDAVGVV